MLIAGLDTTRQTLANGMRLLTCDPNLFQQPKQHPDGIGSFIEEVIRLYSPAIMTSRVAAQNELIGEVAIPKGGATMFRCWGSVNRDASVFPDPDDFKCPTPEAKITSASTTTNTSASATAAPVPRFPSTSWRL